MAVSNLSPFELFRKNNPGYDLNTASEVFFGSLDLKVPPGSQIVSRSPGKVKYVDPEGYTHDLLMQSEGPQAGGIIDNTDRPKILPSQAGEQDLAAQLVQQLSNGGGQVGAQIQPYLDQISQITQQLQQAPALAQLDPQTQDLLSQINQAEQAKLSQQFQDNSGNLLTRLYGSRVNQSSVANNALARLLQEQGLVTQQQQADAAGRQLGLQQYLTGQGLQNLQTALTGLNTQTQAGLTSFDQLSALLQNLTGQQTQRDVATGNIDQQLRELQERSRQANIDYEFKNNAADIATKQANKSNALSKALGVGSVLASAIPGVGPAISAGLGAAAGGGGGFNLGSLLSGGGNSGIGTYAPGGYYDNQGIYRAS